jgi:hypothetical protein
VEKCDLSNHLCQFNWADNKPKREGVYTFGPISICSFQTICSLNIWTFNQQHFLSIISYILMAQVHERSTVPFYWQLCLSKPFNPCLFSPKLNWKIKVPPRPFTFTFIEVTKLDPIRETRMIRSDSNLIWPDFFKKSNWFDPNPNDLKSEMIRDQTIRNQT